MRMQGIEQEVCQLFFAVFCQIFDFASGKRKEIAALWQFVYTKVNSFVDSKKYMIRKSGKLRLIYRERQCLILVTIVLSL